VWHAAQVNADERAQEALQRLLSGEKLPRREPKVPYNGGEGVPIREEIVSRHGETIITRNSYGARCLNTPNVLVADVDFQEERMARDPIAEMRPGDGQRNAGGKELQGFSPDRRAWPCKFSRSGIFPDFRVTFPQPVAQ
jgi:hypothetical protein